VRQRPLREGTIAPSARSAARPQSTNGIAEPRRAAVLALAACALRFFNRANKWRRRSALAHVNR
jgi:hypothetical protein